MFRKLMIMIRSFNIRYIKGQRCSRKRRKSIIKDEFNYNIINPQHYMVAHLKRKGK
jgi:hypothetical protein